MCAFSSLGGVEAAVAIVVCNMSVIIPAILRALGVGDPFMREDTVDPKFSTGVEIARMTSTRVELDFPMFRGTEVTDSTKSEEATGTAASRQRNSVDLDAKDSQKHRLVTAQASDEPNLKPVDFELAVDESDITDSLAQARGLPVVRRDWDIEAGVGGRHAKESGT